MPTYEYECSGCGRVFEIRQRISEPPLTRCDTCGGQVRRLLSPAPFILKGAGWYVTDYPSEARKKALESEKSATSGKSAGDGGGDKAGTDKAGTDKSGTDKAAAGSKSGSGDTAAGRAAQVEPLQPRGTRPTQRSPRSASSMKASRCLP